MSAKQTELPKIPEACIQCGHEVYYGNTRCRECEDQQHQSRQAWVWFAAAAIRGNTHVLQTAEVYAQEADAMLAEYHKRYPLRGT